MSTDLWANSPPTPAPSSGSSGGGQANPNLEWPDKAAPATTGPAQTAPADTPTEAGTLPITKGGYWDAKDARDLEKDRRYRDEDIPAIRRSTAYTIAGGLAAAALAGDALSFGSAAKGKRLDMFLEYLDLIADRVLTRLNDSEPTVAEDETQEEVTIEE